MLTILMTQAKDHQDPWLCLDCPGSHLVAPHEAIQLDVHLCVQAALQEVKQNLRSPGCRNSHPLHRGSLVVENLGIGLVLFGVELQ